MEPPPVRTVEKPNDGDGAYVVVATTDDETGTLGANEGVSADQDCVGVRCSLLDNGCVDC